MKKTAIVLAAVAVFSQAAFAQSSTDPLDTRVFKNGLWIGGGGSWTNGEIDGTTFEDDSFGYNIALGYQFANYFGVNAKYKDLGEFEDQGGKLDVDGYTVGFSAGYPITGRVAVTGGIGYYDFSADLSGTSLSGDEDGLYLSAGLASEIGRIVINPSLIWYDASDVDLYGAELNFFWKFELGN